MLFYTKLKIHCWFMKSITSFTIAKSWQQNNKLLSLTFDMVQLFSSPRFMIFQPRWLVMR